MEERRSLIEIEGEGKRGGREEKDRRGYGSTQDDPDPASGLIGSETTANGENWTPHGPENYWHISEGTTECIRSDPLKGLDKTARNRLLIASLLCLVFMVGEIVGGILSNSLAIISDGVHLLTDFASFLIAMSALHLAQRPASNKLNFGWHRIEILGALLSILLLWILTGVLCYSAVRRIQSMDYEIDSTILLITASTGVFFNICLATVLNEDLKLWKDKEDEEYSANRDKANPTSGENLARPRSPSDGLSGPNGESYPFRLEMPRGRPKPGNINVKAAYIHVLGDLVQSLGILVSALLIWFKPEWKISDPICTFFFSFMVLLTTSWIMKDVLVVLMEAAPKGSDVTAIKTDLLNVTGVVGLHGLRVWSLTLDKIAVSVHLNVAPGADPYQVLEEATHVVRDLHWAHESYIQLEQGATQQVKRQSYIQLEQSATQKATNPDQSMDLKTGVTSQYTSQLSLEQSIKSHGFREGFENNSSLK